jgi:hypothetical protein
MSKKKKLIQIEQHTNDQFKPQYIKEIEEHMAKGFSAESFCAIIGTHRRTLYNWAERYPDFFHAIKRGREKSQLFWEEIGQRGAKGKIRNFNVTAYIFSMKNLHRWRDNEPDPFAMIAARAQTPVKKDMTEEEKLAYAKGLIRELKEFVDSRQPILDAHTVGLDKDAVNERAADDVGKLPVALSDLKR